MASARERLALNESQAYTGKRKCFISYYSGDRKEVDDFLLAFGDVFIPKTIGVSDGDDFINSNDVDYVMSKIRSKYLSDSTVTIVLLGKCTHSRRYIDWELKTTLRRGSYIPNGLLGVLLPAAGGTCHLPDRFKENYSDNGDETYALYKNYPASKADLRNWINTAYTYRTTRADSIKNSADMFRYNAKCKFHVGVTH